MLTEQTRKSEHLEPWVTPEEAALIMSIRAGYHITRDDVRQAVADRRPNARKKVNKRLFEIDRTLLDGTFTVRKRFQVPIPLERVVDWYQEFPATMDALEAEGYDIPHKQEAFQSIREQEEDEQIIRQKQEAQQKIDPFYCPFGHGRMHFRQQHGMWYCPECDKAVGT